MKQYRRIILAMAAWVGTFLTAIEMTVNKAGGWAAIPDLLRALVVMSLVGFVVAGSWVCACFIAASVMGAAVYWLSGLFVPFPFTPGSVEEAMKLALDRFRAGSAVRVRCPKCASSLNVARVLSMHEIPDIKITCACGGCSTVQPFKPSKAELL